jgi:hypothetical protein
MSISLSCGFAIAKVILHFSVLIEIRCKDISKDWIPPEPLPFNDQVQIYRSCSINGMCVQIINLGIIHIFLA